MIKIYSYLVIGYDVLMYWYSKDINYEIIFKCFFYIYYFPIFQVKYRLLICGKFIGKMTQHLLMRYWLCLLWIKLGEGPNLH